jgi:hypothetical protein
MVKTRGGKKERPDGAQEESGVALHGKIGLVVAVVAVVVGTQGRKGKVGRLGVFK